MISQKDFIQGRLRKLVDSFQAVRSDFFYDNHTETFYVQLLPKSHFNNKKGLMDCSADIVYDFINAYPNNSLVFFTEGSLVETDDLELIQANIISKEPLTDIMSFIQKPFTNYELDLQKPRKEFNSENTYALAA